MTVDLARLVEAQSKSFRWVPLREAKQEYAQFRGENGAKAVATPLLTWPKDNSKYARTLIAIYGLSLAQADSSLLYNACRHFTNECKQGCVYFAGKGELSTVQRGRVRKTVFLAEHYNAFMSIFCDEIDQVWTKHGRNALMRPNTFADLRWERMEPNIFKTFDRMRFYDYTKWWDRAMDANYGWYGWPGNYRIVWSASEKTTTQAIRNAVNEQVNVAVVFDTKKGQPLPDFWQGMPVCDGDIGDDRWHDQRGVIVGLRAKGRMRRGNWRMVRRADEGTAA